MCDDEELIFGLKEAVAKLPQVLRQPAVKEFFEGFELCPLRKVGTFTFYHDTSRCWKQAVRFLLVGDVFWFDLYYVKDRKGCWCLAAASVSLDDPPTVESLRARGGYLPL
jgi:hypothetical protein